MQTSSVRRFLRKPAVVAATGLSKSEIYKRVAAGTFPAPIPLGDRPTSPRAWDEAEIAAWQEERIRARNSKAA